MHDKHTVEPQVHPVMAKDDDTAGFSVPDAPELARRLHIGLPLIPLAEVLRTRPVPPIVPKAPNGR